MPGEAVKKQWC